MSFYTYNTTDVSSYESNKVIVVKMPSICVKISKTSSVVFVLGRTKYKYFFYSGGCGGPI
jgi:hypothetical protein